MPPQDADTTYEELLQDLPAPLLRWVFLYCGLDKSLRAAARSPALRRNYKRAIIPQGRNGDTALRLRCARHETQSRLKLMRMGSRPCPPTRGGGGTWCSACGGVRERGR